jgi:hypothetical protein
MSDVTVETVATSWIAMHKAERDSPAHAENFWAFNHWSDMREDPEWVWRFILTVLRMDPSDCVQETLSAGPLEDLLGDHPHWAITRVEAEAKVDPAFASLLGGVWRGSMPPEIWSRVQAVWDRRGWDGLPKE